MGMCSKNQIRVLVVDHTVVQQGLQSLFGESDDVEVVGYVGNTASVKSVARTVRRIIDGDVRERERRRLPQLHREELSTRELEVLRQVAKGVKNAQIARRLHIAESTVRTHVTKVLSKLGAVNRVEAALYAMRDGLTTLEECLDSES